MERCKRLCVLLMIFSCTYLRAEDKAEIDISWIRDDFRLAVASPDSINHAINHSELIIDTTYLVKDKWLRDKFGDDVFAMQYHLVDEGAVLKDALMSFIETNRSKMGSFFKIESTVVKVFRKDAIFLFFAYQAVQSEIKVQPGDVVFLQDLGDLF